MNPSEAPGPKDAAAPVKKPPQDMLAQIGFRLYLDFPDLVLKDKDDKTSSS